MFLAVCIFFSIHFDGTAGSGDTTMHFLFSKSALKHPANLLDHWGKPLFTLFSMPFSQFGFTGIKIFNSLVAAATVLLTCATARKMSLKYAILAPVLFYFAPLYFVLIFSGLTEHFFALVLILGVFLAVSKKPILAAIVISFLPFARSEGLIFLGGFAIYFISVKKYHPLPWLLSGHLAYGLAGWFFVHHDFLWIFRKIPYAHLNSVYGSGTLFHYFRQMNFVTGIPEYLLLALGVIFFLASLFLPKLHKPKYFREKLWLIYGGFAAFFVAHSLFWYFGIFNSMGLKRVLIDVMPLMVIIMLDMINRLDDLLSAKITKTLIAGFFLAIVVFPFLNNPYAIKWPSAFTKDNYQKSVDEMAGYIKKHYQGYKLFYEPSYLSVSLDIDHFDPDVHDQINMAKFDERYKPQSLVVWDSYYAGFSHITTDYLESRQDLYKVREFKDKNGKLLFVIFTNCN